jgi:RNA polymerase sigma-70 factor (ECF subfamily)
LVDKELIEECRKGNLQNFRKLIEISSPLAFSVSYRMLGDEEEAKDVVQDSMVTIWLKINKIKSSESFMTWLYKIVVNKCYDRLRKRTRNQEIRADEKMWEIIKNCTASEQSTELEYRETALIINLLTEKLSPVQKAVFVLGDLEEMSHDEISAITGMSRRNIKASLYYARKKMSEMIKKHI